MGDESQKNQEQHSTDQWLPEPQKMAGSAKTPSYVSIVKGKEHNDKNRSESERSKQRVPLTLKKESHPKKNYFL